MGNKEEVWKDILGYEGLYKISNSGRIINLKKNKEIISHINKNGYVCVSLLKNKIRSGQLIHRLIASAFIPNPDGKPHINHIDCNRSNNSIENLEWCTPKENIQHASRLGRMTGGTGGKREGSGRKQCYGEPTIQSVFRIPKSKKKEIRERIKEILKEYKL